MELTLAKVLLGWPSTFEISISFRIQHGCQVKYAFWLAEISKQNSKKPINLCDEIIIMWKSFSYDPLRNWWFYLSVGNPRSTPSQDKVLT